MTEKELRQELDEFLVKSTMWAIRGGDDEKAAIFQWLSHAVGSWAAVMSGGNAKAIDELLTGSSQYQFEVAAEKARMLKMASGK